TWTAHTPFDIPSASQEGSPSTHRRPQGFPGRLPGNAVPVTSQTAAQGDPRCAGTDVLSGPSMHRAATVLASSTPATRATFAMAPTVSTIPGRGRCQPGSDVPDGTTPRCLFSTQPSAATRPAPAGPAWSRAHPGRGSAGGRPERARGRA